MRCKNQGSDYDDENIQWTCSASLPPEFKLGSTDVICEGFKSSQDPYVLKGSCGVEYRLLLTEAGEERYGRGGPNLWRNYKGRGYINWPAIIFWALFVSVVGWMIYSAFIRDRLNGTRIGSGGNNPWGWGGGGGGGGRPDHDPPPPYDYGPSRKPSARTPGQEGWRPGFWSGAGLGGAAAYLAANRRQNQQPRNTGWFTNPQPRTQGWFANEEPGGRFWGNVGNRYDNGEGSSGWGRAGPSTSSTSSSFSSTRHESSGFGSTSRR